MPNLFGFIRIVFPTRCAEIVEERKARHAQHYRRQVGRWTVTLARLERRGHGQQSNCVGCQVSSQGRWSSIHGYLGSVHGIEIGKQFIHVRDESVLLGFVRRLQVPVKLARDRIVLGGGALAATSCWGRVHAVILQGMLVGGRVPRRRTVCISADCCVRVACSTSNWRKGGGYFAFPEAAFGAKSVSAPKTSQG